MQTGFLNGYQCGAAETPTRSLGAGLLSTLEPKFTWDCQECRPLSGHTQDEEGEAGRRGEGRGGDGEGGREGGRGGFPRGGCRASRHPTIHLPHRRGTNRRQCTRHCHPCPLQRSTRSLGATSRCYLTILHVLVCPNFLCNGSLTPYEIPGTSCFMRLEVLEEPSPSALTRAV